MKKIVCVFWVLSFLITSVSLAQGKFSISTEKPKPGEKITVTFNPSGTKLSEAESVSLFIHAYGKTLYYTDEINLKKNLGVFKSEITVADSCAGVVIRIVSGEDENAVMEYLPIRFYSNEGKLVKYASAGLAMGYYSWFSALGLEREPETAYNLFSDELTLYPEVLKDVLFAYHAVYSKVNKEKADEFLKTQTQFFEKKLSDSEEDLQFLTSLYRLNKETAKYESTKKFCIEKYPKGNVAQQERFLEYYNSTDQSRKEQLAAKFREDFPNSQYLATLNYYETQALMKAGKYEEVYSALKQNPKASSSEYNSLAWAMCEKDYKLNLAKEIAHRGVELSNSEDPLQGSSKPPYYSDKQLKKMLGNSKYAILDTYGAILLKLGENEEALKYLEEAYKITEGKDSEVNERYSQSLVATKKFDNAKTTLEKCITNGKSTAKMKDLLKEVFIKSGSDETAFEKYFSELSKTALEKSFAELKKKMINQPAPTFTLEDLDGKKVSLADLKGKVVIVDFWATWCGPCKASFPGMQKAVNKYANNPNVKFLFVNTWEQVENKKKNAADFISQNKYSFHVLMDYDNKVIESYKVEGIPTKFIIDKDGNIRFKSVGFSGSDEKLVEELSAMISMVQ